MNILQQQPFLPIEESVKQTPKKIDSIQKREVLSNITGEIILTPDLWRLILLFMVQDMPKCAIKNYLWIKKTCWGFFDIVTAENFKFFHIIRINHTFPNNEISGSIFSNPQSISGASPVLGAAYPLLTNLGKITTSPILYYDDLCMGPCYHIQTDLPDDILRYKEQDLHKDAKMIHSRGCGCYKRYQDPVDTPRKYVNCLGCNHGFSLPFIKKMIQHSLPNDKILKSNKKRKSDELIIMKERTEEDNQMRPSLRQIKRVLF